jgi:hypothetical protein
MNSNLHRSEKLTPRIKQKQLIFMIFIHLLIFIKSNFKLQQIQDIQTSLYPHVLLFHHEKYDKT